MALETLWGDISKLKRIITPITILKEQADWITKETNEVIIGHVTTSSELSSAIIQEDILVHHLSLTVPLLNNYRISVLKLSHEISIYPVQVEGSIDGFVQ